MDQDDTGKLNHAVEVEPSGSTYPKELEPSGFHARLSEIIEKSPSANAFARESGISPSGLQRYQKGGEPTRPLLVAMADAAGVSLEWLATGRGSPTPSAVNEVEGDYQASKEFALVPRYDVTASAGGGALVESEHVIDHLAFRRAWLVGEGLQEGKLAAIQARGDSMQPSIMTGDMLLVDLREEIPCEDGIYVIHKEFGLVAKRVQRMFDGSIYIRSDNPKYQAEQLAPDHVEHLTIIGRVVWVARRI